MYVGFVVGIPFIHSFFHLFVHSSVGNTESTNVETINDKIFETINDEIYPLVQFVKKDQNVTDETMNACLALINKHCFIRVLDDCPPLDNETALSLYRDKKHFIGHQKGFDRGTIQNYSIRQMIEEANADLDSSDLVGTFVSQLMKSVQKGVGEVDNCFFNLNPGPLVQDQSKGEFNKPSA